jgi:hypothetical protein
MLMEMLRFNLLKVEKFKKKHLCNLTLNVKLVSEFLINARILPKS